MLQSDSPKRDQITSSKKSIVQPFTIKIMSEFLMLFRGGDGEMAKFSPEQVQAHMQKWGQWMGGLQEAGKMLGAEPLAPTGATVSGTKMVVTDGPYLEGKEMVGGYLMCKAESMAEAIEIAKGCPVLEFADGNVEVREITPINLDA